MLQYTGKLLNRIGLEPLHYLHLAKKVHKPLFFCISDYLDPEPGGVWRN